MFQGNAEILAGSRPDQGTGTTGKIYGGRPPTGWPVCPGKNAILPESLGPSDLVLLGTGYILSGIGTDRPTRRRPAALDHPVIGGTRAAGNKGAQ